MAIEPLAFGFESEEALLDAVRARYRVPAGWEVAVYVEVEDGRPILVLVVTGRCRAHTAAP